MFLWQLQALHPIKVFRRINYREAYQIHGEAKERDLAAVTLLGPLYLLVIAPEMPSKP